MGAPVVHFEIQANDAAASQAFYGELFGWEIDANDPMNYGEVTTGAESGIQGGIAPAEGPPMATFYIEVSDPQAALDAVVAKGGSVVVPVTEIPGTVTFALFSDLDGITVGLVKSEE